MMKDILIVGAGPAGLTAAIYARRAEKSVLVLEKGGFGGQMTFSPKIENYPGYATISGSELADKMTEQAAALGAELEPAEVLAIRKEGDSFVVETDFGNYEARTVILAVGAKHRMLGLSGEEDFVGNGISYCAVCDGAFYKGQTVAMVGGGNSALQEALLLAAGAKKVTILQNLDFLTGEAKLQDAVAAQENIEVITGVTVSALRGDKNFRGVEITHTASGEKEELSLDGLFVAIGLAPDTVPFTHTVDLDSQGYVLGDESTLTSMPGIFVAGDCRKKQIRQITTAVADGASAALAAIRYCDAK